MLRSIPLPSFLSTKRGKLLTAGAAGTVAFAAALSLVAVTAPSSAAPAPTDAAAFMTSVGQPGGHSTQATDLAMYHPSQATLIASSKAAVAKATVVKVTTEAKAQAAKAAAAKAATVKAAAPATQAAQATPAAAPAAPAAAPSGTPQQIAQQMLSQYGWSASQFSCLQPLWYHESGWSVTAENPSSGAYGIPQSLPASQMASAGPDWQTNPATQIKWGLNYIQQRYGSPCGAWAHEQSAGWY